MNLLVTAGNTLAPIDRVHSLTNVFTGRTGAAVALHAHGRGHLVVLLTSPRKPSPSNPPTAGRCSVIAPLTTCIISWNGGSATAVLTP